MCRYVLTVLGFVAILGLAGCKVLGEREPAFGCETFLGSWVVDYDRTMEAVKHAPENWSGDSAFKKMTEVQAKGFLHLVYRLEITADEIAFPGDPAVSYTVVAEDKQAKALKLAVKRRDKKILLTLQLIDGGYMNINSNKPADMDYLIWKRAEGPLS